VQLALLPPTPRTRTRPGARTLADGASVPLELPLPPRPPPLPPPRPLALLETVSHSPLVGAEAPPLPAFPPRAPLLPPTTSQPSALPLVVVVVLLLVVPGAPAPDDSATVHTGGHVGQHRRNRGNARSGGRGDCPYRRWQHGRNGLPLQPPAVRRALHGLRRAVRDLCRHGRPPA